MKNKNFDAIIIGGSYSGLAAGMALGRALKQVLIIDSGSPCNRQTPFSHNFLTQDGKTPSEISLLGRKQLQTYTTVSFLHGLVTSGKRTGTGFEIELVSGETFAAQKLIFATGIKDIMKDIEGFAECWGISVLHCPYCHGYEVRNEKTGIIGNGESGFELSKLISNWTKNLTFFTNGPSSLTGRQVEQLGKRQIIVVDKKIRKLDHINGNIQNIVFEDETEVSLSAIYAPTPFLQHCQIPESLGCELTSEGYIKIDQFQQTTIEGVFVCGDNASRMRTVANAVAMGTAAGISASKKMIMEEFDSKVR
ncbi:NAD(P)/FAD-dependent oxidoreductase [Dyadobacter sp. 32]|uniref:NAD(P)/FAD-dependent oxidoreductase n=1 Tax=Dyadobacter sp. 32 TaxID=538966 RepID=UPI0011EEAD10